MNFVKNGTLVLISCLAFSCSHFSQSTKTNQDKLAQASRVTAAESEGLATINPPAEGFSPNPTQGEWGKIEGQRRLGGNDKLKVCTFNIQFLGNYKNRDNHALADYMKKSSCDMVVVQELIAPPNIATLYSAQPEMANKVYTFPDHTPIVPNEGNTDFFKEMRMAGFDKFWLSDQDTGNSETNQSNGTATEWFVVFYKNWLVSPKLSLPHGFLHSDVTHNPRFDRVPYAFSFQTKGGTADFVLISVHLHPDSGRADKARRKVEITAIHDWIKEQEVSNSERDFIILGDMNIEDNEELLDVLPSGYVSLNRDAAVMTNTNINSPKPYDHIMFNPDFTSEIKVDNNFELLSLHTGMASYWTARNPTLPASQYPGLPENYRRAAVRDSRGKYITPSGHDDFRVLYSDHHPVKFDVDVPQRDDD